MSDSILIGLIALLLSLLMLGLLQSYFSSFLGEKLAFSRITSRPFILFLAGLGFAVSVLAGIYPAFYLAAFRPMVILSHLFRTHPQQGLGRKILVVVQITIAVSLIIGSQIIHQQLDYMHQYAVQFDREQLLVLSVNATPIAHTHYDAFVKQITAQPAIISATGLRNVVGIGHIKEPFSIKGNPASQQMLPFYLVRHHFVETFGLQVIVGRDFSNQFPTDETEAILINQTLAQQFGWRPADAIGKMLTHPGWGDLKVIGVIHDFNFESLHRAIKPLVIKLIWPARQAALTDYLAVRVNPRQLENTIQMMRHTWKQYAPQAAFDYYFLDQKLRQFYHHEATLSQVSSRFTLLALILACFGLLGLISFSTERKTKEIALRKVLGASVLKIVGWMAREFALLVLIANCIAGPLAYLAGKLWLQNFAYRIQISPWIFVLGAGITFFTSMAAILFHTLKAAYTNPVDFLRSE